MKSVSRFRARMTIILLALITSIQLNAAPFVGKELLLKQPDNSKVRVIAWGDEYYQHVESPDGYTLIRDPQTQWICYATYNENHTDFISTGVRYDGKNSAPAGLAKSIKLGSEIVKEKRIAKKNQMNTKNTSRNRMNYYDQPGKIVQGTFMGLTLLVDFPDVPATTPQSEMNNFFNQVGYTGNGNNGSVRDYFYSVSNAKVTYTNHVTAYYRALHPKAYYDNSTNGKAGELMIEALENLKASGFNFNTLSISNGEIVALNMYYTGYPEAGWSNGLWPHASYIGHDLVSGVRAGAYQMTNIGANPTLGTVCHENGHMLMKWPDLYDYGYESSGAGGYCLMAFQGPDTNPVPPNPAFRAQAGWQTLTSLNGAAHNSVHSVTAGSFTCYKYSHQALTNEYFVIENIQRTGRWVGMPDDGIAIWHIDENGNNSNEQMTPESHYMVSIEQADGLFDLEHGSGSTDGDLFHSGYRDAFNNATLPSSKWWSGAPSNLNLVEISNLGNVMTFKYLNPVVTESWVTYQAEDQTWGQSVFETTNGGYTGTGYVNTNNAAGSYVNFAVNVPTAKSYQVKWRFANGTTTQRNVEIRVNGNVVIANQPGPGTGAWTTWQEATFTLPLNAGTNNIRFVSLTSGGAPNLDKIEIQSGTANSAPVVQNPMQAFNLYQGAGDTTFSLTHIFSDPDNDYLFFTATSSNESVINAWMPATNTFTLYIHSPGQSTISLKAVDILGNEVTHQFVVTVLPNERPEITNYIPRLILCTSFGAYSVDLDTCFSDPDGDPISFSLVKTGTTFTAAIGTGNVLTVIPTGVGTGSLEVHAKDNKGSETYMYIGVRTRTSNSLPVISSPVPDQVLYNSGYLRIDPADHYTDADGDRITFTAVNLSPNLIEEYDDEDEIYYVPQVTSSSPFLMKLKITDGSKCGTTTAVYDEFMLTIMQNNAPVVVSPVEDFIINMGEPAVLDLSAVFSDPDGHALDYSVWNEAVNGSVLATNFSQSGSMLTITPDAAGTDIYHLFVDDGFNMYISYEFRVTVTQANQPPVVSALLPDRTLTQGAASVNVNLNSHFSDPDADLLTYSITSGSNGNVNISGNTLTINTTVAGTWQLEVQAADGNGGSVSNIFQLTVNASTNSLCFEAEAASGQSLFAPFQVMSDANASGGQYIVVPNGTGNVSGAPANSIAAYTFNVATTATYNIWVRILAANSNDNSVNIRLDASGNYTQWTPGTYTSWTWKKWTSRSISAGSHTLYLARHEDGLKIDKVLLTQSSSTPSGTGCGAAAMTSRETLGESLELTVDLKASPNPVSEELMLALQLPENTNVELSLHNSHGTKVGVVTNAAYEPGEYMLTYQMAGLPSGIYILKLQTNSGVITKTIIKN